MRKRSEKYPGGFLGIRLALFFLLSACANPWGLTLFKTQAGWGYEITHRGEVLIYQPTVPARPGRQGFASEKLARQVGMLALKKVRNRQFPPRITQAELDSLEGLSKN